MHECTANILTEFVVLSDAELDWLLSGVVLLQQHFSQKGRMLVPLRQAKRRERRLQRKFHAALLLTTSLRGTVTVYGASGPPGLM